MPKFKRGRLMQSRGVNDLTAGDAEFARFVLASLRRHILGDWGDLDDEDKQTNDRSLAAGLRVLSAYKDARWPGHGVSTIWIITEADRSATTILFPNEY